MTSLNNPEDNLANMKASVQRLVRAIMLATGQFSLILACCNSVKAQPQILSLLQELSTVDIQEIVISPAAETLYTTIVNTIGTTQPTALIVKGLESVVEINQLIISTNLMRDEFRKNLHFPIVLWINDEILGKLVWLAPDLKNWAASTIRFDCCDHQTRDNSCLMQLNKKLSN